MSLAQAVVKSFIRPFSGKGKRGRLVILTYHRVRERPDEIFPGDPDRKLFSAQMRMLSRYFNVLTLSQATSMLRAGRLPPRSVCVTFDDGYADNHEIAAPILEEFGIAATFFIATGYINGGIMWNDRIIETLRVIEPGAYEFDSLGKVEVTTDASRSLAITKIIGKLKYLPDDERNRFSSAIYDKFAPGSAEEIMMTDAMVQDLDSRGMEIGAHTVSHPILKNLDDDSATIEIRESKRYLESLLKSRVTSFAYPNGRLGTDVSTRDVNIVRESGFDVAVTTEWGAATTESDFCILPRVGLYGSSNFKSLLRLCRDYRSDFNRVAD